MKTARVSALVILALACGLASAAFDAEAREPEKGRVGPVTTVEPEKYDVLRVGDSAGGSSVVPTNQVVSPLGEQVVVPTRVNALAISPDGRWLAGLGSDHVVMIDLDAKRVTDSAAQCGSVAGIVFSPNGQQLFASDSLGSIEVYAVDTTGQLKNPSPFGRRRRAESRVGQYCACGNGRRSGPEDHLGRPEHGQYRGGDRHVVRPSAAEDRSGQRALRRALHRGQGVRE